MNVGFLLFLIRFKKRIHYTGDFSGKRKKIKGREKYVTRILRPVMLSPRHLHCDVSVYARSRSREISTVRVRTLSPSQHSVIAVIHLFCTKPWLRNSRSLRAYLNKSFSTLLVLRGREPRIVVGSFFLLYLFSRDPVRCNQWLDLSSRTFQN